MPNITLERSDLAALVQAMNEVCNGPDAIDAPEFRTRMGVSKRQALEILKRTHASLQEGKPC